MSLKSAMPFLAAQVPAASHARRAIDSATSCRDNTHAGSTASIVRTASEGGPHFVDTMLKLLNLCGQMARAYGDDRRWYIEARVPRSREAARHRRQGRVEGSGAQIIAERPSGLSAGAGAL